MDYNNGYYNGGCSQPYYGNTGAVPDRLGQYRTPYQQQTQPAQMPMPTYSNMPLNAPQNNPIWVQGEEGAKGYMVARNSSVVLWDSENPVIYLKSADENGVPSMRIFDLKERMSFPKELPAGAPPVPNIEYITRGEFDALRDKLNELLERENSRDYETKPVDNKVNLSKSKEDKRNG